MVTETSSSTAALAHRLVDAPTGMIRLRLQTASGRDS